MGANYAAGFIWGVVGNTFIKGQVEVLNLLSRTQEGDYTGVGDVVLSPLILGGIWAIFISWPSAMPMRPPDRITLPHPEHRVGPLGRRA